VAKAKKTTKKQVAEEVEPVAKAKTATEKKVVEEEPVAKAKTTTKKKVVEEEPVAKAKTTPKMKVVKEEPVAKATKAMTTKDAEEEGDDAEAMLAELQEKLPGALKEHYYNDATKTWDLQGMRDDLEPLQKKSSAAATKSTNKEKGSPTPEEVLAQLLEISPRSTKEDYWDAKSKTWDMQGLQDDLALASNPEKLFEELLALSPDVLKEDYFDGKSWDDDGLRSDLEVSRGEPSSNTEEEEMLEELMSISKGVTKGSYFNDKNGKWDTSGLEEDLERARKRAEEPKKEAKPKASKDQLKAEAMFAELCSLEKHQKKDYFDDENQEWDVDGLKEDLTLARAKASNKGGKKGGKDKGAEKFAELQKLQPANEEDYFDSGEWDMEGLEEDLKIAREGSFLKDPERMMTLLKGLASRTSREDYYDKAAKKWDMAGLQEDLQLVMGDKQLAVK